jgi:hypothetical protein
MFALRTLPPDRVGRSRHSTEVKKPLTGARLEGGYRARPALHPTSLFWAVYEQQGNTISLVGAGLHRPAADSRHHQLANSRDVVPVFQSRS